MKNSTYIDAQYIADGFRDSKNNLFAERDDITQVLTYARMGAAPSEHAFINTIIGMTCNTLLENVAKFIESAEGVEVQIDHTDTAMMIAMILEDDVDKTGRAYRNPDERSEIWRLARLFDAGWELVPQATRDKNDRPWDIEILPELVEAFPSAGTLDPETIGGFIYAWIEGRQNESL